MATTFDGPKDPELYQVETLGNGLARVTIYDAIKCCQVPFTPYGKPLTGTVGKMDTVAAFFNKDHKRKAKINV